MILGQTVKVHNGWQITLMGNWYHAQREGEHKWIWTEHWMREWDGWMFQVLS